MKKLLVLVAVSAAISTAARGQDTRSDAVACRDTASTGTYRRCALWMEGSKVRRGEDGVVITQFGFFTPPRLTRVVRGDSAMAYANLFERRTKQSMVLGLVGGSLVGLSLIQANCSGQYNGCQYDFGFDSPAFGLLIGGAVMGGVSSILQTRARRAAAKSIWWNNARFAR